MAKQTMSTTLIKVLVMIAGIVLIMLIRANVGDLVAFSEQILNGGAADGPSVTSLSQYSEAQQEEMKKLFSGFWTFSGELKNGVAYDDLIEIKENGIVWQYETSLFTFPYGDQDTLVRVSTSYLLPYQPKDSSGSSAECYSKLIRQNWVIDGTPCYGKSVDLMENMLSAKVERSDIITMWDVTRSDDTTLVINDLPYKKYSGDIYKFFHEKAVAAIESIEDPSVKGCRGEDPHLVWVRDNIIAAIKNQPLSPEVVVVEQKQLIRNFYIPLCLSRVEINFSSHSGETYEMKLTVSEEGSISEVALKGPAVNGSPRIRELIETEVKEWILPASGSVEEIVLTITAR